MLKVKVTNQEKFKAVSDVDLSDASNSIYQDQFDGDVLIQLNNGREWTESGQHNVHCWEDEFGFIIVE